MLTRTGHIEFNRYRVLERVHGADKTVAILNEISGRLEDEGYLYTERYSDKQITIRAEQLYDEIVEEWTDDPIPYKDKTE